MAVSERWLLGQLMQVSLEGNQFKPVFEDGVTACHVARPISLLPPPHCHACRYDGRRVIKAWRGVRWVGDGDGQTVTTLPSV